MRFTRVSPLTGKENTLDLAVTASQLRDWQAGTPIQRVMPHLTDDEREFLLTGLLPGEFDTYVGPEDDEPDLEPIDPSAPDCPDCNGTGLVGLPGLAEFRSCNSCNGTGKCSR